MADEGALSKADGDDIEPMDVDIEFVKSLPDGRVVMPLERKGKFVWLVVEGEITPQAAHEMVTGLQHIVRSGLWQQNWQPPQTE